MAKYLVKLGLCMFYKKKKKIALAELIVKRITMNLFVFLVLCTFIYPLQIVQLLGQGLAIMRYVG